MSGTYRHLVVRGRADGFDPERRLLEEVKTFKGDLDLMPANHRHLHWAQAKVYGALLCRQLDVAELTVALVYFDIGSKQEAPPLLQQCTAIELQAFFEALCERFIAWADAELAHRERRDAALTSLRFPHEEFRAGQRDLAKAVFNAARLGRCLLAQAPTGIGKTIATLFPLLKACPVQELDKIFFLTAKGSGRSAGTGCTGDAPARPSRHAAAGHRTGCPRQVLRAPRQGVPRRVVPAGQGLLRSPARGAHGSRVRPVR